MFHLAMLVLVCVGCSEAPSLVVTGISVPNQKEVVISFEVTGGSMPSISLTGPGRSPVTLTNIAGTFSFTVKPQSLRLGDPGVASARASNGQVVNVQLLRERPVGIGSSLMRGLRFEEDAAIWTNFVVTANEVYNKVSAFYPSMNVSRIRTKETNLSLWYISPSGGPAGFDFWNANHRYNNSRLGTHDRKNFIPVSGLGFECSAPENCTAQKVSTSRQYRENETSKGISKTTALQLGDAILIALVTGKEVAVEIH